MHQPLLQQGFPSFEVSFGESTSSLVPVMDCSACVTILKNVHKLLSSVFGTLPPKQHLKN
jgi:hypothetical protein